MVSDGAWIPGGGLLRAKGRWPAQPSRFRWIVDGHNAIFRHPRLEQLQVGGRRSEARRGLEEIVGRFAMREGVDAQIVYDGNTMERNPDMRSTGRVRTSYSLPPDEEADDRIVFLVRQALERGERVAVVSSDRATLGLRLPQGVVQVEPDALFQRVRAELVPREKGRPPGDYKDIEEYFLRAEAEERARRAAASPQKHRVESPGRTEEPGPAPRPAVRPCPARSEIAPPAPARAKGSLQSDPPDAAGDRPALIQKKARGLEKQQRRLAARSKARGGRKGRRK